MAHKKKHYTRKRKAHRVGTHKRRRRMGATRSLLNPSGAIVKYGSVALGYLLADTVNGTVDSILPASLKSNASYGYISGGGVLVVGAMLAFKKTGSKKLLPTVAGGVLVGAGLKKVLQAAKVISGFRQVPVIGNFRQVPVISGYNVPMNGYNVPMAGHKKVMGSVAEGSGSGIHDESRY